MPQATAIIVRDREGTIVGWSPEAHALLGYAAAEAVGRTLEALCGLTGDEMDGLAQRRSSLRTKSGRRLRVTRSETPLHDAGGAVNAHAELLTADESAPSAQAPHPGRAAAETLGIASLHALVAHAPQGCLLLDREGRVALCNAALARMFGYEPSELSGLTAEALVPADVRRAHAELIRDFVEAPRFQLLDEAILARRKDGSVFAAQVGVGPVRGDSETFVLVSVVDVSATRRLEQVQRESEAHFRLFVQALPQQVWTCEPGGECDFVSSRWEHYTGLPVDAQVGRRWSELVHPDDQPRVARAWHAALEAGTSFHVEQRLRRHDGAYRWFDTRASPMRDGFGRIIKWVGSNTDVHETRETRAALQHEQQLLQRIVETAPGAFCSLRVGTDGSTSCPFASQRIEDVLGFTPAELARDALPVLARIHPEDLASVRASLRQSARARAAWHCEFRLRHPRRGEMWIEGQSLPIVEDDGATHWFGFMRDITERKRSEESLRATQAQLVAALDAGGMGIWSWDTQLGTVWMDDALLRMIGRRREELSGTLDDVLACVHEGDGDGVRQALQKLASTPTELVFECRIVDTAGSVHFLAVRGRSERDESGRIKTTALNIDVTDQHRAAEARLRSQKLEALGTLAGGIAHDFNNILQAITGNTALALRTIERQHRAQHFLGEVAAASARASDLVRRILTFSRPGEQRVEVIALQPVIAEALRLVRATLPANIEIRQDLGSETLHILADGTQIHQIVVNLATNAAHAIASGDGCIAVRVETVDLHGHAADAASLRAGYYAVLEVSDDGSGMAPDTLARIFDPFFTTKPVGQGTGLGLSVVHGLAKSLGGAVTVESELGRGTRFRLHFPVAEAPKSLAPEPTAPGEATGQRILFVDDEEVLVVLGTHILDALGYRGIGFHRPREALEAFSKDPESFDAVVTDLSMPGLSGFELAKRLRAQRDGLPVIMMSGFVGPEEIEAASQIGVRELLLKPVSIEQLGHALSRLFAAGEPPR